MVGPCYLGLSTVLGMSLVFNKYVNERPGKRADHRV